MTDAGSRRRRRFRRKVRRGATKRRRRPEPLTRRGGIVIAVLVVLSVASVGVAVVVSARTDDDRVEADGETDAADVAEPGADRTTSTSIDPLLAEKQTLAERTAQAAAASVPEGWVASTADDAAAAGALRIVACLSDAAGLDADALTGAILVESAVEVRPPAADPSPAGEASARVWGFESTQVAAEAFAAAEFTLADAGGQACVSDLLRGGFEVDPADVEVSLGPLQIADAASGVRAVVFFRTQGSAGNTIVDLLVAQRSDQVVVVGFVGERDAFPSEVADAFVRGALGL